MQTANEMSQAARPITHGTRYAYTIKRCRCDACRAANTSYMAAYRERPEVIERELQSTPGYADAEARRAAAIEALL